MKCEFFLLVMEIGIVTLDAEPYLPPRKTHLSPLQVSKKLEVVKKKLRPYLSTGTINIKLTLPL